MTTTPDISLPPGFTADDWQPTDPPHRVIYGTRRILDGHPAIVGTAAVQFCDGTVDDGEIGLPSVYIDRGDTQSIDGLSSGHARQLARALIAAADELDALENSSP